jgi:DNA-binding LytR/AlgR family response regulator
MTRRAALAAFLRRHRETWVLAGAAAALLGGVGAFETGNAAPWTLYSYWAILTLTGGAISASALDSAEERRLFEGNVRSRACAVALFVTVAMTPFVWLMSGLALNGSWEAARMLHLVPQVLIVTGAFVPLQMFVRARLSEPARAAPGPEQRTPRLADRLPGRLRGAELHAIEAEDHYLRLHTAAGSALILMRLTDAMAELVGIDGARTHRSWWVARDAVVEASRGRGRAVLRLKNGLTAPVSRTYAPALREARWF